MFTRSDPRPSSSIAVPTGVGWGIVLAVGAALISGVAIYLNAFAVKQLPDAAVYTTLKNGVAAVVLLAIVIGLGAGHGVRAIDRKHWPAVLAVGVIGGSVPFVLFFSGLAQASAPSAAFVQKTLFVWVALLAVPFLGERLGVASILGLVLLLVGQALVLPPDGVRWGLGETLILAATLLWAAETVLVKQLLGSIPGTTMAALRMGVGLLVLVGYLVVSGRLGEQSIRRPQLPIDGGRSQRYHNGQRKQRKVPRLNRAERRCMAFGIKPTGQSPIAVSQFLEIATARRAFPPRTQPDKDGKPWFQIGGNEGPPKRADEKRRHVFVRESEPVRIKIMLENGGAVNWYRVQAADSALGWQARKPDGFHEVPYVGGADPFDREVITDDIYWPEGEKDVDTLNRLGLLATTFGGTADGLPEGCAAYFVGRNVVVLADNDTGGRQHAEKKAALVAPVAASVRAVHFAELPEKERQVLTLYYLEELTMKEVGMVMGVGESRVSQIHSMAVVRLRVRMAELTASRGKLVRGAAASR
jgi:drug/metabolite transporter (DMT)-like permease